MAEWKQLITSGSDAILNDVTANSFTGNLTGTATEADVATQVMLTGADPSVSHYLVLNTLDDDGNGHESLYKDSDLRWKNNLLRVTGSLAVTGDIAAAGVNATDFQGTNYGHTGDSNTKLAFVDDGFQLLAGTVNMLQGIESTSDELVVNNGSVDMNFRVESNSNLNMLFVDGGANRVGIGTSSPDAELEVVGKTQITKDTAHTSGIILAANETFDLYNPTATDIVGQGSILTFSSNFDGGGSNKAPRAAIKGGQDKETGNRSYGFLSFYTSNKYVANGLTERMRIATNGDVGIGTDSPDSKLDIEKDVVNYDHILIVNSTNSSNDSVKTFVVKKNGTEKLRVYSNGDVDNANNSYGSTSDLRLKENIVSGSTQWSDIKALKFKNYNLIGDNLTQLGVLAQDLEIDGMSGLVDNEPATEHHIAINSELSGSTVKSVKYSILNLKAIKALQEAMEKIESLELRISQLEDNI